MAAVLGATNDITLLLPSNPFVTFSCLHFFKLHAQKCVYSTSSPGFR